MVGEHTRAGAGGTGAGAEEPGTSTGGSTAAPEPASESDSSTGEPTEPPEPPAADTFPGGVDGSCGNVVLPFAPPFDLAGPSAEDAYWMMWFSRRTVDFGQPAVAAELAALGWTDYEEIEVPAVGLQAFVTSRDDAVVVAFRGSQEITDWLVNLGFAQIDGGFYELDGRVHLGFATALDAAWGELASAVEARAAEGTPVWITGHSLGGAMATLAATRLSQQGVNVAPVYVFGQPRAGDRAFAEAAHAQLAGRFFRFVNERDLVPRMPPWGGAAAEAASVLPLGGALAEPLLVQLDYAHVGTMFQLEDDAVIEHPPLDDGDDAAYWGQLDAAGWFALVAATEQGTWHLHDEYLCKLRRWAFGA